jgi:enediyne biosynthesis protein E5
MSEGITNSVPAVPQLGAELPVSQTVAGKNVSLAKNASFGKFKPYLAPILISCILIAGNYQYGILESNFGTAAAILTSILLELVLSLYATGRWPHLASCYITGISVGILVRSPLLLPYILCSMLSISSKYALRVKGRHIWNPSNLGVSVMLFLVPDIIAPLSQQLGNEIYALLIIMCLGSLILFTLGRLHITLTYAAAFIFLSFIRSLVTDTLLITEIALLTAPAYQLFMFFMITDPKTTTRTKFRQCAVAVLVAVVETILRLCREIHAPYYALFIVAPVTNLLEIWWDGRTAKAVSTSVAPPNVAEGGGDPRPATAITTRS